MKRYCCKILYRHEGKKTFEFFQLALTKLGFDAKFVSVYFDEFTKPIEDISYNETNLLNTLKKRPETIVIKNRIHNVDSYDASEYFWFRFKLAVETPFKEDTYSLEWSNKTLDFLISSSLLPVFLDSSNLIYCYCYDQNDSMKQSNSSILNPGFGRVSDSDETSKDFILNNAIDLSEHWGRYITTRGMTFMAAPLMWFGEEFFKLTAKEHLLKFPGSSIIDSNPKNLVFIQLFDLYDDPSKAENRQRQKEFWEAFNLEEKATQYEADRPIDFIEWYKEKASRKNKKE